MYIESVCNYFHDYRRPLKCTMIKITITIENGQSLKLCQTRQGDTFATSLQLLQTTYKQGTPSPQMVFREG
jgi:hypothetical protein